MPRSARCDYYSKTNHLVVDCHLRKLDESIAQLQIRASNLRCSNRDQVHMVEEGDHMIHLQTPEVSEEPEDIEANFTCDTSPIVDLYLDSRASSHVTGDRSLLSSF